MDLKLSVLLGAIDRATAPLRSIQGSSSATSKALRETSKRLKELEKAQADLKGFRELKAGTERLRGELNSASKRATELGRSIAGITNPTRAQTREFAAAKRQAERLNQEYQTKVHRLQSLREGLKGAGINTRNMADHERRLRDDIAAANKQMDAQRGKLQQLTQQQQRMAAARQSYERSAGTGAHLAIGGYAAMQTGRHLLGGISPTIDAAREWQTQVSQLRSLGVGEAMVSDATKFAKAQDIMGTSATENLKLLKESYSVLRDMHEAEQVAPYLARMKFGIETVMAQGGHGEGHGDRAETMFMDLLKVAELRGAAKDPEKLKRVLDFATQAYVSSGGLVKPEDMLNMIKTGGVAAKQLDDSSFFFGLLHTMQEMGGHRAGTGLATAYQNWAAGRTTQQSAEELAQLGLLNPSAVKYGKTGHVTKLLPDALKDGEQYRSNPYQFLMDKVIPKLNPDGQLNDQQVISKINALFSGRKGGDLFASLYLERANIAKQLAAAPKAYGVNALYNEASNNADGQVLELEAKKRDLYRELGTQLLPLYVSGLQKLVTVVRGLNTWSQQHPALAKGVMVVAGAMGVLMTAVGGLMVALGGLISQFAMLRFMFRMGGLRLGGLFGGGEGGGLLSRIPMLSRFFPALAAGARTAAGAVAGLSWPLTALITALSVGALLVRKYWGPITAWFSGVREGIGNKLGPSFRGLGDAISSALAPLKPAFDWIANGVGAVWRWISQLWAPFQATREQLDGARQSGVAFGELVGGAISGVIDAITLAVRAFVWFGEALGNAAGWVVVQWEAVKTWFADMWQAIGQSARETLDWISNKLQGVRDLIERIRNLGRSPAPAGAPIEWIMPPEDGDRARRVADAIGRSPMPGGLESATGSSAIVNTSPVGPRGTVAGGQAPGAVIHIDARGADPSQTKRAVKQALDEHARSQRARSNSSYNDGE